MTSVYAVFFREVFRVKFSLMTYSYDVEGLEL